MSSFEVVRTLLCDHLALAKREVLPESRLAEDLGADSLDKVEISILLEQELDVFLSDETIEGFVTVRDIYECVDKVKQEKGL